MTTKHDSLLSKHVSISVYTSALTCNPVRVGCHTHAILSAQQARLATSRGTHLWCAFHFRETNYELFKLG